MKLLNTSRGKNKEEKVGYKPSIEVRVDGSLVGTLESFSAGNINHPQIEELELGDLPMCVGGNASFELDVDHLEINVDFMRLQGINFADSYDQMALDFPWHFVDLEEGDE